MFSLWTCIKVLDDKKDILSGILLLAAESFAADKHCYQYLVSNDRTDKNLLYVSEIWSDQAAHDRAVQLEGNRKLIAQASKLLDGQAEFKI